MAVALQVIRDELRITEREHVTNRTDRATDLAGSTDLAKRIDGVRDLHGLDLPGRRLPFVTLAGADLTEAKLPPLSGPESDRSCPGVIPLSVVQGPR